MKKIFFLLISFVCLFITSCDDKTLPAPTNVHAEEVDYNVIRVSWNAVPGAVRYVVTKDDGTANDVYNHYFDDYNPHDGVNTYSIAACNKKGEQGIATVISFDSGGGGTSSISAPTGVMASIYEDEEGVFVYVKWNNVSNAVKYNIYYSTSNESYSNIGTVTSNYCYITNPNTNNYVKVTAVNSNGTESNMSNYAYCSYNGGGGGGGTTVPNAPTGVTATNVGSSSSPQIKISWNSVSNATSYKVYRSSSSSGSYSQLGSATSNTYSYDNNPLSGYNYYKIKAVNSAGESSYSSYAYYNNTGGGGGTTSWPPCPPNVSVSGSNNISVSWTVASGSSCGSPTSYEVYKRDACSSSWNLLTTTTSTYYSDYNTHPGINWYAVKAINSEGYSTNYGQSASIPLSKPSSFNVQKTDNTHVKFTWSKVQKATGYQIFQSNTPNGTYSIIATVSDVNATTLTQYFPGTSGTTYYFKMKAVFMCDNSSSGNSPVYSDFTTYKSVTF